MQVVVIQLFDIQSTLLQLATRMATFIGSILAFDSTLEDWPTYVERAEQFMKANKVKDEDRVPRY